MTCGFEDQSIDTGRFVLSRINNENYQFHHIRFDCIQGEQGELVFELFLPPYFQTGVVS